MSTALDHGEVTKFRYDTHGAPCTGLVQLSWSKVSTLKIALNKLYDLLPKFSVTLFVRIECFLSVHVKWLWAYMAELGKSSPLGKFLSKMKNDHYHSNSIATKFVCILKWAGEYIVWNVENAGQVQIRVRSGCQTSLVRHTIHLRTRRPLLCIRTYQTEKNSRTDL